MNFTLRQMEILVAAAEAATFSAAAQRRAIPVCRICRRRRLFESTGRPCRLGSKS